MTRPMMDTVLDLLASGEEGGEPITFVPNADTKLMEALDAFVGSIELVEAVETLMAVAYDLSVNCGSPSTAPVISRAVERQSIVHALRQLGEDAGLTQAHAPDPEATLERGPERQIGVVKRAPKFGDAGQAGSVPLHGLIAIRPRRM